MCTGVPSRGTGHNHGMPVETTAAGAAVLEIERFEWVTPDRIEIVGYWTGLRGRRFVRPTLVLKGEGAPRRLLALLEHKPWSAHEGEEWTAAFAWKGEVAKFEAAELNVGSGIDLELPSPRMRPGKPRRFRQRVVARDASRDAETPVTQRARGIVSDAPAESKPKRPSTAAGTVADAPAVFDPDKPSDDLPATESPDQTEALRAEAESARADAERIRGERDALRRERDQALERLRAVRGELEAERQAREKAVADARADEREKANRMLGEGAELRASVERQREIAYLERDDAFKARDEAIEAREKACEERDAALVEARTSKHDRKEAFAQRDRAMKIREQADVERLEAVRERDEAIAERLAATKERDEILRVHDRGLPVHPPKPRFLPEEHEDRTDFDIWAPRVSVIAILLFCAFFVLRLFSCG